MRVLMVGPGLLPIPPKGWGAIEEVVWQLSRQLEALGHEVEILNQPNLSLVPFPTGFDVVHCHWAEHAVHLTREGVPYLYTCHSHLWPTEGEQAAINGARYYLALHRRMMKPDQRGLVVGNGVNCQFYRPDYRERRGDTLLAVGGAQPRKRLDRAIAVLDHLPDMRLVIVGPDADDSGRLRGLARGKNVEWVGSVDKNAMRGWYQRSDVLLFASEAEAFALVPMEAMACGTPVVASPEHGMDYVGVQVADGPAEMAEKVRRVLSCGHYLTACARWVAENCYDWALVTKRVVQGYKEALSL